MSRVGAIGVAAAIELEGVTFRYPGASEPAVESVSMRTEAGERLGILGPNGGGKSTLLRLILGLVEPTEGRVRVFGASAVSARGSGLIGYVPQRTRSELRFPATVLDVVRMPLEVRAGLVGRVGPGAREAAERALGLVGASELMNRPIGRLSGGQLQRVMLARAVASGPRLLLLDEPTVGIDVSGQRRFAGMMAGLARELSLTVVTVSHDLRAVALSSDRVACLRRRLHYHDAPLGLTPGVLSELFSHDMEAIFGPDVSDGPRHDHDHGHDHAHEHAHAHDHDHAYARAPGPGRASGPGVSGSGGAGQTGADGAHD